MHYKENINDTDKWNELTKSIDSNNLFVSKENAEQLPGWINKDNAQYQKY